MPFAHVKPMPLGLVHASTTASPCGERFIQAIEGALEELDDPHLCAAVRRAIEAERVSLAAVEALFLQLTSQRWPRDVVLRFFNGWHDTHLSAASVAAVACRLLARADATAPTQALAFYRAAEAVSKIIHEDLGLMGPACAELYDRLATSSCRGDEWALRVYRSAAAADFAQWLHGQHVRAPALADSLITTIASEVYRRGECAWTLARFEAWMGRDLGFNADEVHRNVAYIKAQAGGMACGHLLWGVDALRLCHLGEGTDLNYGQIETGIRQYLRKVAMALTGLGRVFGAPH